MVINLVQWLSRLETLSVRESSPDLGTKPAGDFEPVAYSQPHEGGNGNCFRKTLPI